MDSGTALKKKEYTKLSTSINKLGKRSQPIKTLGNNIQY